MMNSLKNSSELLEASRLINDLLIALPESLLYEVFHEVCPPGYHKELVDDTALFAEPQAQPAVTPVQLQPQTKAAVAPLSVVDATDLGDSEFVGDRLEALLSNLCRQSGFQSAVVADDQGLPIGGFNTPIMMDQLAAFSSVLGTVIDKVPYFFDQTDANNISVDISYLDKAVVRKFMIRENTFFLLIICSQDIDERAYIELFSDQITSLLER